MSLALLFPGQGSQFVGMGRELAGAFPEAQAVFDEADSVLGFGITELMWSGDEAELTETRNAQPALLIHSVAAYRVADAHLGDVGFAAGHSPRRVLCACGGGDAFVCGCAPGGSETG